MSVNSRSRPGHSIQFWLLASFLVVVFLMGGASRIDVLSLAVLRPVSVLMCAAALLTLRREHVREGRWLLGFFAAICVLAALHLVPLPPVLWQAMPGRVEIAAIDALAGLGDLWRPLTLTPMAGWHALASLFAPLAVLLLGLQLSPEDRYRLLPVVIALAVLSGVFGILQTIGSVDSPLYLYRITNTGWAVGLFANRNHGALLLAMLLPMLAVFAATTEGTLEKQSSRRLLAVAVAIVLFPLILVSGSRAGLFLALLGFVAIPFIYRRASDGRVVRRGDKRLMSGIVPLAAVTGIVLIATLTIVYSRAKSIDRLLEESGTEGSRSDYWAVAVDMLWKYFPFGSGSGSFPDAYQIVEPEALLNLTYLNRAHNDWLETAVTFGLPGMALLALIIAAFAVRSVAIWRRGEGARRAIQFARMATVMVLMIALASIPDYPLRTPIMMCLAALCGLWMLARERSDTAAASREEGAD